MTYGFRVIVKAIHSRFLSLYAIVWRRGSSRYFQSAPPSRQLRAAVLLVNRLSMHKHADFMQISYFYAIILSRHEFKIRNHLTPPSPHKEDVARSKFREYIAVSFSEFISLSLLVKYLRPQVEQRFDRCSQGEVLHKALVEIAT
jgi:hypothetical protein